MFQNNNNKNSGNNNINDLLSFLGGSSLVSQKKPSMNFDSMNSKKSNTFSINENNKSENYVPTKISKNEVRTKPYLV